MSRSRDYNLVLAENIARIRQLQENQNDQEALIEAAAVGDLETVKTLISGGVDINIAFKIDDDDPYYYSAINLASLHGHTETVQYLIAQHAVITPTNPLIGSPLRAASGSGHVQIVSLLLDAGHYINHVNIYSETALFIAAGNGHLNVVKLLVEAGADIERYNNEGITPLMRAAKNGHTKIVEYLLAHHANINAISHTKLCALSIAAIKGKSSCISVLLQHGADIEFKDNALMTSLILAASWGQIESVKTLIASGADVDAKDSKGKTPLDHALINRHWEVVNLFRNSYQHRLEKIGFQDEIPYELRCPITQEILNDPVTVSSGHTFDRSTLIDLFHAKDNPDEAPCPLTRKMIKISELHFETDAAMKAKLEAFVSSKEAEAAKKAKETKPESISSVTEQGLFAPPARPTQSSNNQTPAAKFN